MGAFYCFGLSGNGHPSLNWTAVMAILAFAVRLANTLLSVFTHNINVIMLMKSPYVLGSFLALPFPACTVLTYAFSLLSR